MSRPVARASQACDGKLAPSSSPSSASTSSTNLGLDRSGCCRTQCSARSLTSARHARTTPPGRHRRPQVRPLLEQGAGPVLAAFVDAAAGLSPQHLSALEQLIAAKRRQR